MTEKEFLERLQFQINTLIEKNAKSILQKMSLKHFETSGKLIRPKLIFDLTSFYQLPPQSLVGWAVSCELLHNATLVHDDLQDNDQIRRGKPTIWKLYGPDQAINVGDFFFVISPQGFLKSSLDPAIKQNLGLLFSSMSAQIIQGQVLEFHLNEFNKKNNFVADYLECISHKTAALFSALAAGVALVAQREVSPVEKIFSSLGCIFQIQDDILDLYGDKQRDMQGCDIQEGKMSFLVAQHLENHLHDFEKIVQILKKPRLKTSHEDIYFIKKLFKEKRTLSLCLSHLNQLIDQLLENDFLKAEPKLRPLIEQHLENILKPIEHLNGN